MDLSPIKSKKTDAVTGIPVWLRSWWRRQSPNRQDRYASIAPLITVLLFLAAIVASFSYLRLEEIDREQETIKRDVEYAQQRLRLRLLERQEQLMRVARDVSSKEIDAEDFTTQAETLINNYPELHAITWIDSKQRVRAAYASSSASSQQLRGVGSTVSFKEAEGSFAFNLAKDLAQPMYSRPILEKGAQPILQLHIPLTEKNKFAGVIMGEYSVDGVLRYGVPNEITAKYAVSLINGKNAVLAGQTIKPRNAATKLLPWAAAPNEYQIPVSPVGNDLVLRAQAYRTSLGLVGSGLFWLTAALSALTVWMLVATWRHTRRRMRTQQALISETNFRRAMENSMLTGMRALDMQGKITYVNPAFCEMTGWTESELIGTTAPFPYWPAQDYEILSKQLEDELAGRSPAGGFQIRVKRKNGKLFDARMYVSPLIDAKGQQTGLMTSTTDITEPNRVRQQLLESQDRFITVLEGMDASVSVAPLGRSDLLFANKMYRQWFGGDTVGHLQLIAQAGVVMALPLEEMGDDVDSLAGLPLDQLSTSQIKNFEIFIPELSKWLEVRSRYLTWVDGRLAQMVIATDITSRRDAEALALQQAERAQSASRLITMGEMASSVAHELNQPLTAINNYCNGIVSRIKAKQISEEEMLGALDKTAKQAQRAGQIIQRIRSFVKRSAPNRTASNVQAMVEAAKELAEIEMRRRNVHLRTYVAARLPDLLVDPILIEQVLINLLKNAAESVDAAQRSSANRTVELRVTPKKVEDRQVIEFAVVDSGLGLQPEVMARLYESFFSTKAEGMGMGLSLCRSIIESHLGRIAAENIYNGADVVGCRFAFWLPLQLESLQEATTTQNAA
ncbi:MAG: PAS domain S-box protein [Burkholderiaceae bacterium]